MKKSGFLLFILLSTLLASAFSKPKPRVRVNPLFIYGGYSDRYPPEVNFNLTFCWFNKLPADSIEVSLPDQSTARLLKGQGCDRTVLKIYRFGRLLQEYHEDSCSGTGTGMAPGIGYYSIYDPAGFLVEKGNYKGFMVNGWVMKYYNGQRVHKRMHFRDNEIDTIQSWTAKGTLLSDGYMASRWRFLGTEYHTNGVLKSYSRYETAGFVRREYDINGVLTKEHIGDTSRYYYPGGVLKHYTLEHPGYSEEKLYHPSGVLQLEKETDRGGYPIGVWKYYNENGKLLRKVEHIPQIYDMEAENKVVEEIGPRDVPLISAMQMPEYQGDLHELEKILTDSLNWEKLKVPKGSHGIILGISRDGKVQSFQGDLRLDNESARVLKKFARFKPAKINGRPVASYVYVKVEVE